MAIRSAARQAIAMATLVIVLGSLTAQAAGPVNKDANGAAIAGYDPVAYFTWQKPVKGKPDFTTVWEDARWLFATAEHRDLFIADPVHYAPQFGGFCTGGVRLGVLAPTVDPEAWIIVDGRLYLSHDKATRDEIAAEPQTLIGEAEESWASLTNKPSAAGP